MSISLFFLYSFALTVYGFKCSEFSYNCNAIEDHFLEISCHKNDCVCGGDPNPDNCISMSPDYETLKEDCKVYCNNNAKCQYYKYMEVSNWFPIIHHWMLCSGSHWTEVLLLDEQHTVLQVWGLLLWGASLWVTGSGLWGSGGGAVHLQHRDWAPHQLCVHKLSEMGL